MADFSSEEAVVAPLPWQEEFIVTLSDAVEEVAGQGMPHSGNQLGNVKVVEEKRWANGK